MKWLSDPARHFPRQINGDLIKDGDCGLLIARKLRVSQPAAAEHLKILAQAGFLTSTRIKKWTFYKRNEKAINAIKLAIAKQV